MDITFTYKGKGSESAVIYDNLDEILGISNTPEIDSRKMFFDDDEAFKRWSVTGTIYPKLLGGALDSLSNNCQELIAKIVDNSYAIRGVSIALRDSLIEENIIDPETTFQDVINNGKLKAMIFETIKLKLNDNPRLSQFGGGIVSDFDLMANLQGNDKFNERMKQLGIAEESEQYKKLKTARGSVRRFIVKIRDSILLMMELPETPTKEEIVKDKRHRNDKTKGDVADAIAKKKENLKRTCELSVEDDGSVDGSVDDDFPLNNQVVELCEQRRFLGQRSYEHCTNTFDEYATHREVVEPLIEHLGLNTDEFVIWDPCCGSLNAICNSFHKRGFQTLMSDIQSLDLENFTTMDFLTYEEDEKTDFFIVTNPPWSKNKQFLQKLVSLKTPFCCLMKLDVIGKKYFRDVLTSKSSEYSFHGLPLPKGRFYCVETGKDIQMSGVFWLIGNYIPKGYEYALEQSENIRTCPLIMKTDKAIEFDTEMEA
jgi:hypothetical protein